MLVNSKRINFLNIWSARKKHIIAWKHAHIFTNMGNMPKSRPHAMVLLGIFPIELFRFLF